MSAGPLKEQCPNCHGQGTVPHLKRVMANGEVDPADFRLYEICEKCGGGGKVGTNLKAIAEKKPGFIADQTGD
jgi:DnaJ-class molecular chaperone